MGYSLQIKQAPRSTATYEQPVNFNGTSEDMIAVSTGAKEKVQTKK